MSGATSRSPRRSRCIQVGNSEIHGAVDRPADENYPLTPTSPYSVSISTLVEQVARDPKMRFDDLVEIAPGQPGEDAQSWIDSPPVKKDLGWEPQTSLEEDIKDMVAWGRTYLPLIAEASAEYVLRA